MYVCMDSGHGHHQQQHLFHRPHMTISNTDSGGGAAGTGSSSDRFPQWSMQETRDFLMIRAELDPTFMETKRNKLLWDIISNKMKEKCYNRSSDQCKCKWKNLVTRYKGCETMEAEGVRQQFPFYNELQAIFAARMQRMLWMEAEGGPKKKMNSQLSSDDDDENEDSEGDQSRSGKNKKRKVVKGGAVNVGGGGSNTNSNNLKEILEEFMKKQMVMEAEWMRAYEAREEERRVKEMEWRQTMESLENERIMMERRWREREEQRRIREEVRAENRDALITTLLNKLQRQEEEEDDPTRLRHHHHRMQ